MLAHADPKTCKKSLQKLASRSGDLGFVEISPGQPAANNRPMYAFFECGTFSKPKSIQDKFAQVEQHLHYFLEKQRKRQNRPEIHITDIVVVSGVTSILPWEKLKVVMGNLGVLDAVKFPLCNKLIKEGRLLSVWVEDPWAKTVSLSDNVRDCKVLNLNLY